MKSNQHTTSFGKVALIHDVFIEQGGAERVLLELLTLYPDADVFVPLVTPSAESLLKKAGARRVVSSWLNAIPFIHSASILLKPFLFWYWQTLNLKSYTLVISSSHSFSSKAVITGAQTLHISYIHTPPRYLYAEFNETRILRSPVFRFLLSPLLSWLRNQDYLAAQRPDILVANSREVQRRITKYYGRKSLVIYPPVIIPPVFTKYKYAKKKNQGTYQRDESGQYYICFSRLARQKGIDLAVLACTKLNLPLKVIGEGSELTRLQSLAGPTVEFLGRVEDSELRRIFSGAIAMIYPALEEDFGMAPVEVMAHGIPVIAHRSGGVQESVLEGKTGVFFDEWSAEGVMRAIQVFEKTHFLPADCRKQARRFSAVLFRKKIQQLAAQAARKRSFFKK